MAMKWKRMKRKEKENNKDFMLGFDECRWVGKKKGEMLFSCLNRVGGGGVGGLGGGSEEILHSYL